MAEQVGSLFYDISLDTRQLVDGSRKAKRALDDTGSGLDGLATRLTATAAAVGLLVTAFAALKSAQVADDMRLLAARVQVAAGGVREGAAAMRDLVAVSKATRTSVEANADVFQRLNQSVLQMGGTQEDTLAITELLGKAIQVSGASAVEAKSAMLQFGQALGSGKLAGDELRSLLENAPYLMRQLAAGLGVPVGALKTLGEQGKLTSDVVVNALGKAADKINADFEKMPVTIAAAMEVTRDAARRAQKSFDDFTGTSAALTGATQGLGVVLDLLGDQFKDATTEADKLGRNDDVKSWAKTTANILSYVSDAGDGVARVFVGVGKSLGALAAAAAAIASGEFRQAKTIMSELGSDLDELAQRQLAGEKMRERMAAGGDLFKPRRIGGNFKLPGGDGDKDGRTKKAQFDATGYLAGLRAHTADAMQALSIIEAEAQRKNDEHLKKGDIAARQHEEARTLITADFAQKREAIRQREAQRITDIFEKSKREDEEAAAREQSRLDNLLGATATGQLAAQRDTMQFLADAFKAGKINAEQFGEAANTALGNIPPAAKEAGDAMDEFSKQAARNIQDGLGATIKATLKGDFDDIGDLWGNMLLDMAAQGAAINLGQYLMGDFGSSGKLGGVFGSAFGSILGLANGGPANAGQLYRVNETGRPEMFTAANGSQYMLPTQSGNVTPAAKTGGNVVHFHMNYTIGAGATRGEVLQAMQMTREQTKADILESMRQGGAFGR